MLAVDYQNRIDIQEWPAYMKIIKIEKSSETQFTNWFFKKENRNNKKKKKNKYDKCT